MVKVSLNIYKIEAKFSWCLDLLRLTPYHTGIEVGDDEFSFSGMGEVRHSPRAVDSAKFVESIEIGDIRIDEIRRARNELKKDFKPGTYNLTKKNCNHYSEALLNKLFVDYKLPSYINRPARLGASVVKDVSKNSGDANQSEQPKAKNKKGQGVKKEKTAEQKAMIEKIRNTAAKAKAKKQEKQNEISSD